MKTYLVTGGLGFIGSNFILHCLKRDGIRVINLDAMTYAANPMNLEEGEGSGSYTFVKGDIRNRKLLRELLRQYAPQAIVNFAAESHVDRSIDGPEDFIQTNMVGAFHLLEEARHHWNGLEEPLKETFRFLHVSTDEVYGSLGITDAPFREETPYAPNSPYAASKAASDHLVRAYQHTYGLPTLTTNCSNNYGPRQFPEKLIPLMVLNALAGKPLPVYGDGLNVRDWLYVEDHCEAILLVIEKGRPGEVYNIGGNCERTNLEILESLCALLDEMVPHSPHRPHFSLKEHVRDRPGHDRRYAVDCSKLTRELGWTPKESLESGLRKTIQWYMDHPQWVDSIQTGAYRDWIARHYGKAD